MTVTHDNLNKMRMASAESSQGISGEPIYQTVLNYLKGIHPNCELLEYGAGIGNLLKMIIALGITENITAADIIPSPVQLPRQVRWIQSDLNYPIGVPDNSFDVIVSTEVIEHLENPRATFREFHRILRPGGKLVVTTPNQESIRAFVSLLFGGHFVAFRDPCYPAHITALLRKDFQRICHETGFDSPQFVYTNVGSIPKLTFIHWQQVSFNMLKGRLFSDNVMVITNKQY